MSARRVDMHRLQELVRLHRRGQSERQSARILKMGRKTVGKYAEALKKAGLLDGDAEKLPGQQELAAAVEQHAPPKKPPQQQSTVEKWAGEIEEMLKSGARPKAIHDRLVLEQDDYEGSLSAIKRICRRLIGAQGIQPEQVAIPVETGPGEIAQVDFGYVGKFYDPLQGTMRRAWVFVMVLAHSRHMFAKIVFDQKVETWLLLHAEAFAAFGGVPATVVPDNLKAAVIRAAFGSSEPSSLNRSYRELARHYGFMVDPTPPRQPKKKGKVEASVKYVKNSFFKPRSLTQKDEAQALLFRWVEEIAGKRVHGTTGRRPLEVFELEERQALLPLPAVIFEPVVWKLAKVHLDSHLYFDNRLYSVPWQRIGQELWVRATPSTLTVHTEQGERLATHDRRLRGRRITHEAHLPEHRAAWGHRSRDFWEKRADCLGTDVGDYIRDVFDSDEVLSQLRAVQAIVTHLETFPLQRAQAACRRAGYYDNYSYKAIKAILRKGIDFDPDPDDPPVVQGQLFEHRFARAPHEFAHATSDQGENR